MDPVTEARHGDPLSARDKPGEIHERSKAFPGGILPLQAPRSAEPEQRTHDQPQIARHGQEQVPFLDLLDPPLPGPSRSACFADVSE
jgi:hypothetical protein